MGKLPAYLFYTKDWRTDPALCRVSKTARDTWMDMNCLMFDSEERGVLISGGTPWTDEQIARAARGEYLTNLRDIAELLDMGVAFRNSRGAIFCKRMVRDEQERVAAKKRKRQSRSRHDDVTRMSPIETATASSFELDVGSKKLKLKAKPTIQELTAYCETRNKGINPEAFWDFYESKGWKIGNQPMKNWKAAVRTWEQRLGGNGSGKLNKAQQRQQDNLAALDAAFPLDR